MGLLKIALGLTGLSILILIHELGHFLVARIFAVEVQKFSIGFGKTLFSIKRKETEYAISMIPVGGFCKFKGEQNFIQAIEEKLDYIPREKGSIFSVKPWQRILIALAGPGANLILSLFFFFLLALMPYRVKSSEPIIVLASDYAMEQVWAADEAGLQTGDRILSINDSHIRNYMDLNQWIFQSADSTIEMKIQRDGSEQTLMVTPHLNKQTGGGMLGVYPLYANELSRDFTIAEGKTIPAGSTIIQCNGKSIQYLTDLLPLFKDLEPMDIEFINPSGEQKTFHFVWQDNYWSGFPLPLQEYTYKNQTLKEMSQATFGEFSNTIRMTLRGFVLMFQGLDLVNAMVGPLRAPVMTGEIAIQGFRLGFLPGIRNILQFLAPLGIALAIVNLLPIPALDGGQIILFLMDWIKRKKIGPNFIFRYQLIGSMIVLGLMVFSFSIDILYFLRGN